MEKQQSGTLEFTVKAIFFGLFIGTILTAANTYLGLYAGMTVSGSIPAAIVSMAILRGLLRRGTILENNMVQTIASSGEAVAAGIIFTVPAMVITGVWTEFPFWKVSLIGILGGFLGILFMIPLRRVLIVEDKDLIYPEGVACARVLEAGQEGGSSMLKIMTALFGGVVYKCCSALFAIFRGTAEYAWRIAGSVFYFGSDVSVALLGVGVIVGIEIGVAVLGGSVIAWGVAIPLYYMLNPLPEGASALDAAWEAWSSQIRYMGVGAMIVGGLSSMWKIRSGITNAIRQLKSSFGHLAVTVSRTEQDLSNTTVGVILLAAAIGTFFLYSIMTNSISIAITAGVVMLVATLFFVAVSSYICGLVGSSNNPISGMTICALMFSSLVLLLLGMSGSAGTLGALGVASIVCCAAATGGDTSQDLKTGYLVGATPKYQQLGQFIGIVIPAFSIAPILSLLHNAYGIGTDAPGALRAPQASLFASITDALFGDASLPWNMVWIGVAIALSLLMLDSFLERSGSRFRAHIMPVAVGIYLPLALMVPIFLGGWLSELIQKHSKRAKQASVLIASGLIAGEAIAGILIAIPKTLPDLFGRDFPIPVIDSLGVSVAGIAVAMFCIYWFSVRNVKDGSSDKSTQPMEF